MEAAIKSGSSKKVFCARSRHFICVKASKCLTFTMRQVFIQHIPKKGQKIVIQRNEGDAIKF